MQRDLGTRVERRRPYREGLVSRVGRVGRVDRLAYVTHPTNPTYLTYRAYLYLRGNVDLDLPRLGFLAQRDPNGEHAVAVLGGHLAGVHCLRK